MLAYLRRDLLRALRLAFLLAFVLVSAVGVGQAALAHRPFPILAGVVAAMALLRVADFRRSKPLPLVVDLVEIVALGVAFADVKQMDPILPPVFFMLLCRAAMSGPRRLFPLLVGSEVMLYAVGAAEKITLYPATFVAMPVVAMLVYVMRVLMLRLQEQHQRQSELLGDVLGRLPFPVVVIEPDGAVLLANDAAIELAGPIDDVRAFGTDGNAVDLRRLPACTRALELRLIRADGTAAEVIAESVPSEGHAVIALRDVTAQRHHERQLRHAAQHDALTGLANRALLWQRFEELAGRSYAVVLLDLDGFKAINDTHGHLAGDDLLRGVAQRLSLVSGEEATVARLGGDEFAVLLPGAGDDQAQAATAAIQSCFSWAFPLSTGPVRVGGSLGYALSGAHLTPDEVMAAADAAMYTHKRSLALG